MLSDLRCDEAKRDQGRPSDMGADQWWRLKRTWSNFTNRSFLKFIVKALHDILRDL